MNRKHTVEHYVDIFNKLKKINSEIEFSSDFIIGYPGEEDVDFNDTINLIEKIKFINSYSFIFSPRPGTKASNLKLIDRDILKSRLLRVQELLSNFQKKKNNSLIGKNVKVLVENKMKDENKLFGRNKYLNPVIFEGNENNIGKIINVKINSCNQNSLFGKVKLEKNMEAA